MGDEYRLRPRGDLRQEGWSDGRADLGSHERSYHTSRTLNALSHRELTYLLRRVGLSFFRLDNSARVAFKVALLDRLALIVVFLTFTKGNNELNVTTLSE